jgi:hypothetical protein
MQMLKRYIVLILAFLPILSSSTFAEGKKTFYSSSLDMPCGYDKLAELLSMDVDELILDEDFVIDTFMGRLYTSIPRIVGKDIDVVVKTDVTVKIGNKVLPEIFIHSQDHVEYFGGIDFKFNNNACRCVIAISKTSPITIIENISIEDIDVRNFPLEQQTYITGVSVSLSDNSAVDIRKITADGLYSSANNVIGDSCGNISALYVSGERDVKANLEIHDCEFSNMHNYNSNNKIVLEDTNGIYVCLQSPVSDHTKVHIHNITGVDYGKRLIKRDCSNLLVENIVASSKYHDTLSAVSLNNGDGNRYENAVINDVRFTGVTEYVVGSFLPETKISNVYSEITLKPQSYAAAVFPGESCIVENLTLRGAQMIASITDTDKKVEIRNVDYDDTMYDHGLYGSSLFLTKDAHMTLSNAKVRSDKMCYLFFDNYPGQTAYKYNVQADIDNLTLDFLKDSGSWFLYVYGNNHAWDISIRNSSFVFNGSSRGFVGLMSSESSLEAMKLSLDNVDVIYNKIDSGSTIPFGYVILSERDRLKMKDVKVYNNSGVPFSSQLYSMYVKNLVNGNTYSRLYIQDCNVDECKAGLSGISAVGDNIVWAGGDCIYHSTPSSIVDLNRKQKKFTYKDNSGNKVKWTGKKWKTIK